MICRVKTLNAQVVYATIAEEAIAHYEEAEEEDDISYVIDLCAVGLVDCLNIQSSLPVDEQLDATERKELLTTLLNLWRFGYKYANMSVDIVGAIAQNVTNEIGRSRTCQQGKAAGFCDSTRDRYLSTLVKTDRTFFRRFLTLRKLRSTCCTNPTFPRSMPS
ncbi:MAG: hypothetical protein NVS4B11_29700 [Ktedonobacteraceae bacterium]